MISTRCTVFAVLLPVLGLVPGMRDHGCSGWFFKECSMYMAIGDIYTKHGMPRQVIWREAAA